MNETTKEQNCQEDDPDEMTDFQNWRKIRSEQISKIHDLTQIRDQLKAEVQIKQLYKEIEKLENVLEEKNVTIPTIPKQADHGFLINFLARITTL